MKLVNVQAAKTHLSRLLEEAVAGEEIIIARAGRPQVRLVPCVGEKAPRVLGVPSWMATDSVWIAEDFDAVDERVVGLFEGNEDQAIARGAASRPKASPSSKRRRR